MEIWKDIIGYEGLYQVSNFGNIKRLQKFDFKGTNNCKRIFKEKKHSPVLQKTGYFLCALTKDKITKKYLVHRIVAKAFISNPEDKPQINHINGIKSDNRLENLEWNTRSENCRHAWKNGLTKLTDKMITSLNQGRRHNAKLTNEQVNEIRNIKYYFGLYRELSKKYKITPEAIRNIYILKTYKNGTEK
jgi:hypothetical protein